MTADALVPHKQQRQLRTNWSWGEKKLTSQARVIRGEFMKESGTALGCWGCAGGTRQSVGLKQLERNLTWVKA